LIPRARFTCSIPRLAEDRYHRRARLHQRAHVAVLLDGILGEPRGAEGRQPGVLELQLHHGAAEELLVLGIGPGPAALDVIDAQPHPVFCAMLSLSSTEKETDSPCVPSRRVVSNVKIFMCYRRRCYSVGTPASFFFFRNGTPASFFFLRNGIISRSSPRFDGLMAGRFAHGQEVLAAGLVLFDPLLGEFAGLDLGEDLLHFGARLLVDDARAARVVAVLGGVRNREAHVGEAAFLNQVDDQLQLVQALEVGDLGSVAGGHQGFEAGADQLARAAAQHGLLAEQVAFGLFLEGGFDDAGLEAAERQRIGQRAFAAPARWRSAPPPPAPARPRPRCTARARDVPAPWARSSTRRRPAGGAICLKWMLKPCANMSVLPAVMCGAMSFLYTSAWMVGHQDHDHVAPPWRLRRWSSPSARRLRPWPRSAAGGFADHHVHAGITQVQCVRVALAAVSDNGDRAPVQVIQSFRLFRRIVSAFCSRSFPKLRI
jgi:hypothetical protein